MANNVDLMPAIIADSLDDMKSKINIASEFSERAHLDIMDGIFTSIKSFDDYGQIASIETAVELDSHLMIFKPEKSIDEWMKIKSQRTILHFESSHNLRDIFAKIRESGSQAFVALNPGTSEEFLETISDVIDGVLVLGVHPGFYGNPLVKETLAKVENIRKKYPNFSIGFDGGVNEETLPLILQSGVDWIASGSYIFKNQSKTPKEAYQNLRNIIDGYLNNHKNGSN